MKIHWDPWVIFGFVGQALFASRFIVQWTCSEKRGQSYIPTIFWHLSLVGGIILLIYAIYCRNSVFIVGQATGILVYSRNLRLIYKKRR